MSKVYTVFVSLIATVPASAAKLKKLALRIVIRKIVKVPGFPDSLILRSLVRFIRLSVVNNWNPLTLVNVVPLSSERSTVKSLLLPSEANTEHSCMAKCWNEFAVSVSCIVYVQTDCIALKS